MSWRAVIAEHAQQSFPEECVGLLLGNAEGIQQVLKCQNIAPNRRQGFEVSARELLVAERHAQALGLRVVGSYHSHPDGVAEPSQADLRWLGPGQVMAIISTRAGRANVLRCWGLEQGRVVERTVDLCARPRSHEVVRREQQHVGQR